MAHLTGEIQFAFTHVRNKNVMPLNGILNIITYLQLNVSKLHFTSISILLKDLVFNECHPILITPEQRTLEILCYQ
jgi:hypothetical protein